MPRLLFLNRELAGHAWDLTVERTTIGRHEKNTLPIADPTVSGEHCEILVFGAEVIVRERGSTNGTFVGTTKVIGQLPAKDGDVLRFGSVEARLEFEPDNTNGSTDVTAVWLHSQLTRQRQQGRGAQVIKATIKLPLERLPPPPRSRRRSSEHWMRDIAVPAGILVLAVAAVLALWLWL
jgi:pSer/pThr/pTyr-binding forkhead associated (FHA) protein